MKNPKVIALKILTLLIGFCGITAESLAQRSAESMPHKMQHGFVLATDDRFASHLVAPGHHSRQVEITGQLFIDDHREMQIYEDRKSLSAGGSYFLFQAQNLDLPSLAPGQVLMGHIVESKNGEYSPKNKIVRSAGFRVDKVLLNIPNPFFAEELMINSSTIQSQGALVRRCGLNYPIDRFF